MSLLSYRNFFFYLLFDKNNFSIGCVYYLTNSNVSMLYYFPISIISFSKEQIDMENALDF